MAIKEQENNLNSQVKRIDQKMMETNEKLKKVEEFGGTNRVSIEDLKTQLGLLDRNCDKEFDCIDRRMKKLSDWIQTDTDKFSLRIDNIQ